MAWIPEVQRVRIVRDKHLPQLVRPSITLVQRNEAGDQVRPLIVDAPAAVWYALTGAGVTHQGTLQRKGNVYWHTPVALDGDPMHLVLKVVTDNPHGPAFYEGDVALGE